MLRYVGERLLLVVFAALIVSSIVFLGVHRLPGNPFLSERCSYACAKTQIHKYHLDLPLPEQYVIWLSGVLHGDLGVSYVN
jgi:ABC-type dipeptide/oligopeptide/nickel transport system permease component